MGDCRIRIVISKDLATNGDSDISINQMYSSDTTVREVVQSTKQLFSLYQNKSSFHVWDVTLSRPEDITSWPLEAFPELQGPKSKTLHSAGWFPSGSLLVLPKNVKPSEYKTAEYTDSEYNKQVALAPMDKMSAPTIKFTDKSFSSKNPLPSEVMGSVINRFGDESEIKKDALNAQSLRRQNQEARKLLEKERASRLDQRIKNLEEGSSEKNKKVSDQVRLMLIKSRATGLKSLKQRDRLYFECIVDTNGDLTKEYRYFSPQETFAKIASSFDRPKKTGLQNSEIIVRRGDVYRRFPVSMRVYEAIADGHLSGKLDIIVIRWYSDDEDPSPNVVSKDEPENLSVISDKAESSSDPKPVGESSDYESRSAISFSQSENLEDEGLGKLLQDLDASLSKGKKPKKSSAAAVKVRCMQIKSKAKGDAKRVPKMEDRFFLEVVTVMKSGEAKSSYFFLARKDKIERLLQLVPVGNSNVTDLEFLVATEKADKFTMINDTGIDLNGAEERQILKGFDRIILRQK